MDALKARVNGPIDGRLRKQDEPRNRLHTLFLAKASPLPIARIPEGVASSRAKRTCGPAATTSISYGKSRN